MNKYFLLFSFIFLKNNSFSDGSKQNSKIKSCFTIFLYNLRNHLVDSCFTILFTSIILERTINNVLKMKYYYNYIDKNGKFYHIIDLTDENKNLLPEDIIILNSEKEKNYYSCRIYLFYRTYEVTIIKINDILNLKQNLL